MIYEKRMEEDESSLPPLQGSGHTVMATVGLHLRLLKLNYFVVLEVERHTIEILKILKGLNLNNHGGSPWKATLHKLTEP